MTCEQVLAKLEYLGVALETNGDKIHYRAPDGALTKELREALVEHKPEILKHLNQQDMRHIEGHYQQVHSGDEPGEEELAEIERRVTESGYVFCWSAILEDFIAFHRMDINPATLPPGFVPYSLVELAQLYPEDGGLLSVNDLRLVHAAKQCGAKIIRNSLRENQEPK